VTPVRAEEGLSGGLSVKKEGIIGHYGNHTSFTDDELKDLDAEGRTVITEHRVRYEQYCIIVIHIGIVCKHSAGL